MPPTISPLFRLRLSALGEDLNTWGDPNLNNALKLIEEAVAGPLTLTITGSRTLTADNFQSNEYRRGTHALVAGIGLAAPFTITVPPVAFIYRIDNRTAFAATLKTASGVGAVVRPGMISAVFCDGADCKVSDPTLDQVKTAAAAVNLGGFEIQNAGAATSDTGLATRGQVTALTAASVQLASDWAQKTGSTVDGTEYSAKLWATSTTALTGGNKGAKGYALDASGFASNASGSATSASNSAGAAAASAGSASGFATNAGNSATAADASSTLAGKYADNPEDSPVVTSPTTRYSALHWSRKAQATIGGAKVTTADTTPAPLATKIVRPDGSAYSVTNPGGDERIQIGILGAYQQFLTSGTWTKPAGATWIFAETVGGGASGVGTTDTSGVGGGGGGSFNFALFRASELPASVLVTIGAGGSAIATGASLDGNIGGDTSFGSFLNALGGRPGVLAGQSGGDGGGGEIGGNSSGTRPSGGLASGGGGGPFMNGGPSVRGGAGGGGAPPTAGLTTSGGLSQLGGSGGAGNSIANQRAVDGQVPGGGGGGSSRNGGSGAGGAGRIRVWAW